MPDLHIHRDHHLGLPRAREIAFAWAEQAEREFDMNCTYAEGPTEDEVSFSRSGVSGTLRVTARAFELDARLGFLLGAFKDKIEAEIVRNLDELLAAEAARPARGVKAAKAAAEPAAAPRGKAGAAAKAPAKAGGKPATAGAARRKAG